MLEVVVDANEVEADRIQNGVEVEVGVGMGVVGIGVEREIVVEDISVDVVGCVLIVADLVEGKQVQQVVASVVLLLLLFVD